MSSFRNQAKGHESLVEQLFNQLKPHCRTKDNSETLIDIARHSKNVEAFKAHLREKRLSLPVPRIPMILHEIHRVYPPPVEVKVVQEDPEFLRNGKHRFFSVVPPPEQDSPLHQAAKNHRALIDHHRSNLGEAQTHIPVRPTPIKRGRESFPVFQVKDDIVRALNERASNRALIVVGEPGSGKTNQIPQYLIEAGFSARVHGIGCTHPHFDAAIAAAKMLRNDKIKHMDEMSLYWDIVKDNELSIYSALVIDVAHERSVTTDLLLGLLKNVVFKNRPEIRIVVTLANPEDAERLREYFFNCKLITVPHLYNPVEIIPLPSPASDPIKKALQMVFKCRTDQPRGDILLFLSCQDEVDVAFHRLSKMAEALDPPLPQVRVVSACSSVRSEIDPNVFQKEQLEGVKVVLATSAAETALASLDNVGYVIDLGLTERRMIDARQAIDVLAITPISKASADRRKALVGRRGGKYLQLYTNTASYGQKSSALKIQNLAATACRILMSNFSSIRDFEFVDPPPREHMDTAMWQLYCLEAVDKKGKLTRLGCQMTLIHLDPPWWKVLLLDGYFTCNIKVLIVVAMAQVGSTFFRPGKENQAETDWKHRGDGDHMSWLGMYEAWEEHGFSSAWCDQNCIDFESLAKAKELRDKLASVMESFVENDINIPKTITSGLFFHAAQKDIREGAYRTLIGNSLVHIHPQSVLRRQRIQPHWVVYNKLIKVGEKECMLGVSGIDPNWLIELAPRLFREPTD